MTKKIDDVSKIFFDLKMFVFKSYGGSQNFSSISIVFLELLRSYVQLLASAWDSIKTDISYKADIFFWTDGVRFRDKSPISKSNFMSLERQLHQLFRTEKITSQYGLFQKIS